MKKRIIRFFITKDGFFDRNRLLYLSEKSLYSLLIIKIYKIMFKPRKQKNTKIKAEKNDLERISDCLSVIGFRSKIKAFFRKKNGFKTVKTINLFVV
jgi:hypothetical protein